MTCIVAVKDKNKIYMGGDSEISHPNFSRACSWYKVFIKGPIIIGTCGSLRFNQILQFHHAIKKQSDNQSDEEYIYGTLMDDIKYATRDSGYSKNNDCGVCCEEFIMGYKKNIYKVFTDFSVEVPLQNFSACGSGENFAMGSLYETERLHPRTRIIRALSCAEKFAPGVKQPFKILELEC